MKRKELYTMLFVIALGFISIYIFSILDLSLQESAQKIQVQKYNIYRTLEVLVLIIFGILIEYKKVIFIFKNGINLNKTCFVTAIGLVVLLVLPYEIIMKLGIGHPASIKGTISLILTSINIRSVLSVLTGILIIRSIASPETKTNI